MDLVPADAAVADPFAPAVDPVAAAGSDPAQTLRIEVDELARAGPLVADDGRSWLESIEPTQARPVQDGVYGRARQPGLPGEDVGPDAQLAPAGT